MGKKVLRYTEGEFVTLLETIVKKFVIKEQQDVYQPLRVGQKIKSKLKDGSEVIGTITDKFLDGVEVKFETPRYNKDGNLVRMGMATMDTIISILVLKNKYQDTDKWYSKEEFFNKFNV